MKKKAPQFIYLHGFASGPNSKKAQFFKKRLKIHGYDLHIPDLNVPSFTELSLTQMTQSVKNLIKKHQNNDWIILCSSLGAMVALRVAEYESRIKKIIMLAPAFGFCKRREALLGKKQLQKWETDGKISLFHHAYNKEVDISYSFMEEMEQTDEYTFDREMPIKIFHGAFDEIIPFEYVEKFTKNHKYSEYHLLESDHSLFNKLDWVWRDLINYIPIE